VFLLCVGCLFRQLGCWKFCKLIWRHKKPSAFEKKRQMCLQNVCWLLGVCIRVMLTCRSACLVCCPVVFVLLSLYYACCPKFAFCAKIIELLQIHLHLLGIQIRQRKLLTQGRVFLCEESKLQIALLTFLIAFLKVLTECLKFKMHLLQTQMRLL